MVTVMMVTIEKQLRPLLMFLPAAEAKAYSALFQCLDLYFTLISFLEMDQETGIS